MNFTIETQWTFEHGVEHDVEVDVAYLPGTLGKLTGPPEDCYPPEDPELIIEGWTVSDGLPHDEIALDEAFAEHVFELAEEEYLRRTEKYRDEAASDRAFWKE